METRGAVVTVVGMRYAKARGRVQPLMTATVPAVLDELVAVPAMPFAKDWAPAPRCEAAGATAVPFVRDQVRALRFVAVRATETQGT